MFCLNSIAIFNSFSFHIPLLWIPLFWQNITTNIHMIYIRLYPYTCIFHTYTYIYSYKKKTRIVYEFIDKNYSSFNDKTLLSLCAILWKPTVKIIYTPHNRIIHIHTKAVMIFMTHGNKTLDFEVKYLSEYLHIQLWGFLCLH